MANYGPPGANRPEPWHEPPDEYPWHGFEPERFPPEPVEPPRRPGGRGRTVAVLAVLALLVLGGGAALFHFARADEAEPPVTAPPSATPSGQPDGVDASPNALAPESSADPRFAKEGQCVRNDAPAGGRPKLLLTGCAPKTYEVLRRFDEATSGEKDAEAKCADVDGYTDWYFYNSELDTLDFVLCLRLR
ncbi:LppU/SCO3897 family protein [Micromonospora echinospora]|uniref:LppU/SCO3897 family protein n=1 Tax=Micromonospora echinospora TaxID=1877 RepID=UPI003A8A9D7E